MTSLHGDSCQMIFFALIEMLTQPHIIGRKHSRSKYTEYTRRSFERITVFRSLINSNSVRVVIFLSNVYFKRRGRDSVDVERGEERGKGRERSANANTFSTRNKKVVLTKYAQLIRFQVNIRFLLIFHFWSAAVQ